MASCTAIMRQMRTKQRVNLCLPRMNLCTSIRNPFSTQSVSLQSSSSPPLRTPCHPINLPNTHSSCVTPEAEAEPSRDAAATASSYDMLASADSLLTLAIFFASIIILFLKRAPADMDDRQDSSAKINHVRSLLRLSAPSLGV